MLTSLKIDLRITIIELKTGIDRIQTELADTLKTREIGLMNSNDHSYSFGILSFLIRSPAKTKSLLAISPTLSGEL